MKPQWIELPLHGDERGQLSLAEVGQHVPFDIKRVYWIYQTGAGVTRGHHAHKELEQLAIAVSGSCTMILDDGSSREEVTLSDPAKALYIGPGIWREMTDFSPGCVLLVLASEVYDESDYIRDYQQFTSNTYE